MTSRESGIIREKLESSESYKLLHQLADSLYENLSQDICRTRPGDPGKQKEYETFLQQFEQARGTSLFYPYMSSGIGRGPYVLLEDGSIKLDFISGIGPNYWGHSPRAFLHKSLDDLFLSDTTMQGNLQPHHLSYSFMNLFQKLSGMPHCFISTSGAMAGENALKIVFQKAFPKRRLLAFDHTFAGRSIATAQITDKASYRKGIPDMLQVDYIPFYQESLGPEKSYQKTIERVDEFTCRYPNDHAAISAELIQGEGGFVVGNPTYFRLLFEELRRRDILIWVDEVQTFGRTRELFASQLFGLMDLIDVMTVGKFSQACATLFQSRLKPSPGLLSQTFTASSSAISYGIWGIETALRDGHYGIGGKIDSMFAYFSSALEALHKKFPSYISGPWGIGSMISFIPFAGEEKRTVQFAKKLFENGLVGFICGAHPTKIRFLLPVGAMENQHIDEAISVIERTLVSESSS